MKSCVGNRIGGHRAYFLRGNVLRLNLALQAYAMAFLGSRRYTVVQSPVSLRGDVLAKLREGRCLNVCSGYQSFWRMMFKRRL